MRIKPLVVTGINRDGLADEWTKPDCEIRPYLATIKHGKRLTASEERRLAEAIARGDKDALSRLVECNLGLVVKIAQECVWHGATIDDLIGEGNLALIRAAEQYQPSHGVRFSTYASVWIKKGMRRAVASTSAIVRLPHHILALLNKLRKAERALALEMDRKPTFDEVASSLGFSKLLRSRLVRAELARNVLQESSNVRESGGWSSADVLDRYGPPELAEEIADDSVVMESRLESLDDREKRVLSMRHGFGNDGPMSLSAIARTLGVTKEGIRLIELKAAQKLRSQGVPVPSSPRARSRKKRRRRRGGTLLWPVKKSSKRRRRAATGIQPSAPDAGGAEQKAVPDGAPVAPRRRRKPPYLKECSPNL